MSLADRPTASVVVLTRDAGPFFEEVLERLFSQEAGFAFEVVVVDSGSADGTPELAARRGARVHPVDPRTFDHGATRDLGVSLSRGRYVALLVQDALPADGNWLGAMIEEMEGDPLVAGVYGRQIPASRAGPLARALVNGTPTASTVRRVQHAKGAAHYRALPPVEQRRLALFDDVSSCVRRAVWEEIPFGRAAFGEDLRWGKRVVERGYGIVYQPRSAVYHSHERGLLYDFRRGYWDARLLAELFGISPPLYSLLPETVFAAASLFRRMLRDPGGESPARLALLAAGHALSSRTGAFLGARAHRLSASLERLLGGV